MRKKRKKKQEAFELEIANLFANGWGVVELSDHYSVPQEQIENYIRRHGFKVTRDGTVVIRKKKL